MTEARRILPTVIEELDIKVLWGCIYGKYQSYYDKDGNEKRYGPYASHVTKKPPDWKKQCWDYIGKVGTAKYNQAIEYLKHNPLLPNSRNPVDREELELRLAKRVGKKPNGGDA